MTLSFSHYRSHTVVGFKVSRVIDQEPIQQGRELRNYLIEFTYIRDLRFT